MTVKQFRELNQEMRTIYVLNKNNGVKDKFLLDYNAVGKTFLKALHKVQAIDNEQVEGIRIDEDFHILTVYVQV